MDNKIENKEITEEKKIIKPTRLEIKGIKTLDDLSKMANKYINLEHEEKILRAKEGNLTKYRNEYQNNRRLVWIKAESRIVERVSAYMYEGIDDVLEAVEKARDKEKKSKLIPGVLLVEVSHNEDISFDYIIDNDELVGENVDKMFVVTATILDESIEIFNIRMGIDIKEVNRQEEEALTSFIELYIMVETRYIPHSSMQYLSLFANGEIKIERLIGLYEGV